MKLNFSLSDISDFAVTVHEQNECNADVTIESIVVDSRKIIGVENVAFCAINGTFHNGHDYIEEAYLKGIRLFILEENQNLTFQNDATYIVVKDTLWAIQELAKRHREKFNFPIVLIAGDLGKTMTKEWTYHLLSTQSKSKKF